VDGLESILLLNVPGGAKWGYVGRIDASHTLREQQARAARNQALFREINERIEGLNSDFSTITPDAGNWVCECANEACLGLVQMSVAEYEAVRAAPNRFFVMPDDGHVLPQVERIVERTERYWVVEKVGAAETVAKQADPSSRR
jgi:hypothetical protein